MNVDLSSLSLTQLCAIRDVLLGKVAISEERKELNDLRDYKKEQEMITERRFILKQIGEDIDDDFKYWTTLDDRLFNFVVEKLKAVKVERVLAESTCSIKVPPMISAGDLSVIDTIRQGFDDLKNERNSHDN
jgi:hypothetical protein